MTGEFLFDELVSISIDPYKYIGRVKGKVDDAYLISLSASLGDKYRNNLEPFGKPNRHLSLEWGFFTGINECIVPAFLINKH